MRNSVVVDEGETIKIFRRLPSGEIVYDVEGKLHGGGYPYVTLERGILATDEDKNSLLKIILPITSKERK